MYRFNSTQNLTYRQGDIYLTTENGRDLGITTNRHALTIAGARSGKGAALIIPNLRRWPHNVLVVDPKGENAELTYKERQAMGKNVYVIDPFKIADVPEECRASFNPLADIDPDSITVREDILVIADGMIRRADPKHAEWDDGARDILAGIIAFVINDAPPEYRTMKSVRDLLLQSRDNLYEDAQKMKEYASFGGLSVAGGSMIMDAIDSDKGIEKDALAQAKRQTSWLDSEPIKEVLSTTTFKLSEIKTDNASVYIVLPPQYIKTHAAFLRLFVRYALNVMAVGGSGQGEKCLFILDEFYALGKIEEIQEASGLMPSYGVHLWPFLQNMGQLQERYGKEGMETFIGNADAQIFFGTTDPMALEYVSKNIGVLTPKEITQAPPKTRGFDSWKDSSLFRSDEEDKDRLRAQQENEMRDYQHKMRLAGTPRLTPDQVKQLVSVHDGQPVANSMIVFDKSGAVYNLPLQPYFTHHQGTGKSGQSTPRAKRTHAAVFNMPKRDHEVPPDLVKKHANLFGSVVDKPLDQWAWLQHILDNPKLSHLQDEAREILKEMKRRNETLGDKFKRWFS